MRSRGWTFTNFDGRLPDNHEVWKDCVYGIQGKELCPETGREHWQSYVYYKNAKQFNSIRRILDGIHVEKANGSPLQNFEYCSKDGDFVEYGDRPVGQGARSDLRVVSEEVLAGRSIREIALDHGAVFIKFHKGIRALQDIAQLTKRDWAMDARIYWGAPGTGKTSSVYQEFSSEEIYSKPSGKWWDGYEGERVVLIDDVVPGEEDWQMTLKLLDRYPMKVEVKGGFREFVSRVVIITSNFDPKVWFPGKDFSALERRLTSIVKFGTDTEVAG